MVWPAVIGALGGIAGGLIGSSGQHSANRANIMLQREQRAWEERMSNTEIFRRVQDMKSAGINPMLSVMGMGSASTPSVAPARVENEGAALGEGVTKAVHSALQAKQLELLDSQISATEAQARKTSAEAAITESDVPYSAVSAEVRAKTLKSQLDNINAQFDQIVEGTSKLMNETQLQRELMPLLVKYQDAVTRGEELGLSEKKALSELYENLRGAKGMERLLPLVLSIMNATRR